MNFEIGKINIEISPMLFAAAAFFLSGEMKSNYLWALLFSLLHETGHLAAMLFFGCKPESIKLGAAGAKIVKNERDMSYFGECVTALCGPAVNLVFALVLFFLLKKGFDASLPLYINIGLSIINLLPMKTLDGGRFLYFFMLKKSDEEKADKAVSAAEIITAVCLCIVLLASVVKSAVNTSFVFFAVSLALTVFTDLAFPKKR